MFSITHQSHHPAELALLLTPSQVARLCLVCHHVHDDSQRAGWMSLHRPCTHRHRVPLVPPQLCMDAGLVFPMLGQLRRWHRDSCVSSTGLVVNATYCTVADPSGSQTCNTQSCVYNWRMTAADLCSSACGGGNHTMFYSCEDQCGTGVTDGYCPGLNPSAGHSCNTDPCLPGTYVLDQQCDTSSCCCLSGSMSIVQNVLSWWCSRVCAVNANSRRQQQSLACLIQGLLSPFIRVSGPP